MIKITPAIRSAGMRPAPSDTAQGVEVRHLDLTGVDD